MKESLGFYCALISGAGPTILILTPLEKEQTIYEELKKSFTTCVVDKQKQDLEGVKVKKRG